MGECKALILGSMLVLLWAVAAWQLWLLMVGQCTFKRFQSRVKSACFQRLRVRLIYDTNCFQILLPFPTCGAM
jgi:hypothetical protein